MKKTKLLFFSIMAFGTALLISSCGKDEEKVTYAEDDFTGEYRGAYAFENLGALIDPVPDTITISNVTAGDNKIGIYSKVLNATFTADVSSDGSASIPTFESDSLNINHDDSSGVVTDTYVKGLKLKGSGSINGKTAGSKMTFTLTLIAGKLYTTDPDFPISVPAAGFNVGGGIIKVKADMTKQ